MSDEEKKEIEKKENSDLAKPISFDLPESLDDFDIQDLRLSNLFICQDQSNKARDNGVGPGMLYDSLTFEAYEKMNVVMFFKFTSRILYGVDVGDSIRCYSQDGKMPAMVPPINQNCISCQENIRPSDQIQAGKSKYGDCNRTFNFACIPPDIEAEIEKDFPFIIPMQRMNAPLAKKLVNVLFRKRQELFAINRTIETEQISNEHGRFYVYKITDIDVTNETDIERARYWLGFLKKMQQLIIDVSQDEEKNITPDSDIPF